MLTILRPTVSRVCSPSTSRAIGSSSRVLAAATKGKPAGRAKPAPKKAANTSFSKKPATASGGGGGGGGSKGGSGLNLTYSEARPIADLSEFPKLYPEIINSEHIGKPTLFSSETFNSLKQFGLPRRLDKELSESSSPASVIRQCTLDLAKRLDSVREGNGAGSTSSLTITGERGSGKSMLLLQTVSHALNSGWIVLYDPKCSEWINSSSSYFYNPQSQTFHQPSLATSLLSKLLSVNESKLASLKTSSSYKMEGEADVEAGTSLVEFIKLGMRTDSPKSAVPVLQGVVEELTSQSEIPFLIALDEVQSLYTRSKYLTPSASPLESYHLSIPKLFLSLISPSSPESSDSSSSSSSTDKHASQSPSHDTSSPKPSPKGRYLTLTSISYSTPSIPPTTTLLAGLKQPTSTRNPLNAYTKLEPIHLSYTQGVETFSVDKLGGKEAGGMMQLYVKKGLGGRGDEAYLSSLVSSGGNALEFGRGLSRSLSALI